MIERTPSILLVSNLEDFTTDYVAALCKDRNCDYFRINSEDIVQNRFTYIPLEKTIIANDETVIDLRQVRSIYFRRAPSQFPAGEPTEDDSFLFRERREFLEGLLMSLDARWMNPIAETILGERKIRQLSLAKSIGLRIPKTLATNDSKLARDFIDSTGKVIAKPVSHGFLQGSSTSYSIYTNEIKPADLDKTLPLMEAPMLMQEMVPNKADIRVTLVGEEVFSASIIKEDTSAVDWRRPEGKKVYESHTLPQALSECLLLLNRRMGLIYSAIDLILTPDEEYVFLEVNPVGEWLWLELELGLPISDRILRHLMR
ncbi:hypothetical protein D4R75_09685 [bacterium]|nr:MAG: hypothetical protein D4R75_09685 [bacterium]